MKRLIWIVPLVLLQACAKGPDAIVATDIPMAAYTQDSCDVLARNLMKEQENLAALSKSQKQAVAGDAIGVFLIGVPASSLTGGDKEGLISNSKGKINAMEAALHQKKCAR